MELILRITLKILAAGLFVLSTTPAQAQFQVTVPNMTIVDGGVTIGTTNRMQLALEIGRLAIHP